MRQLADENDLDIPSWAILICAEKASLESALADVRKDDRLAK